MYTFSRWVTTPENRAARLAAERVATCLGSRKSCREADPLLLHGPAGTGKTHLASAVAAEVIRQCPELAVTVLAAGDFDATARTLDRDVTPVSAEALADARQADLLVLEDVQHLTAKSAEALVQLLDDRLAHRQQTVITAAVAPARLTHLPARLTSRLTCGLVVGLELLAPPSRLALLQDRAARRQLAVSPAVLGWLAEHVGGSGRALEGALARVEALARLHGRLPDAAAVAAHFRTDAEQAVPSVERIAERVSACFRVEPKQLQSRRRHRQALLPRQVGMYLARRLTPLSLDQIGAYFGGRDHSTVLHACRKVEAALERDAALSGAVRQLHAELV